MIVRKVLVAYLEEMFSLAASPDVSYNGLQFEGADEISSLATGVDATVDFIRAAGRKKAQFAIVHHGLFWKGKEWRKIDRFARETVTELISSDLNLFAIHLPLDGHPEVGNNARIAQAIDARPECAFGEFLGRKIGTLGKFDSPISKEKFKLRCERAIGPVLHHLDFGPPKISKVGIVSGGGWDSLLDPMVYDGGLDAILTGEVIHQAVAPCRERKIHLFALGHYATETFGVKALGEHLSAKFGLKHTFINLPTGL